MALFWIYSCPVGDAFEENHLACIQKQVVCGFDLHSSLEVALCMDSASGSVNLPVAVKNR